MLKGGTIIEVIISMLIIVIVSSTSIIFLNSTYYSGKDVCRLKARIISNDFKCKLSTNNYQLNELVDSFKLQFPDFSVENKNKFYEHSNEITFDVIFKNRLIIKDEKFYFNHYDGIE